MKYKILHLLKENKDSFVSGQSICENIGVSRTAVWKYINILKNEGYEIESISRKGYKLLSSPDLLTPEEINENLDTIYLGKKIIHFDTINSTNIKAKELAASGEDEGTIIISEEQTLGRGRLGRNWTSPKYKGIWMSIILRPNINPIFVPKVTQIGAAAVAKSSKELGIETSIKWPNDIILNNKKVCGILTEMSAELNKVNYVIMGIGINVNIDKEDFPEDIQNIATSFKSELGKPINRKTLLTCILNNFENLYNEFVNDKHIKTTIDICRKNSALLGKEVRIIKNENSVTAKAIDIDDDGHLIVQHQNGDIEPIISGEVSIRGLYGYI